MKTYLCLALAVCSFSVSAIAHAQFVQGGSSGSKIYLCEARNGKLIPGVATSTEGTGFKTFASLILKAKQNYRLSYTKRQKRVRKLKSQKQQILTFCTHQAPITPAPAIPSPISGTWNGNFSCEGTLGVNCMFTIKIVLESDGRYSVVMRGAASACLYSQASSAVVPFGVDAYGTYHLGSDGLLKLQQVYSSAAWKTCPFIGSTLIDHETESDMPIHIIHHASLGPSGRILIIEEGQGNSSAGLPFNTAGVAFAPDEFPLSYIRE